MKRNESAIATIKTNRKIQQAPSLPPGFNHIIASTLISRSRFSASRRMAGLLFWLESTFASFQAVRQAVRKADRQTGSQADRQTDGQTDRQPEREIGTATRQNTQKRRNKEEEQRVCQKMSLQQ